MTIERKTTARCKQLVFLIFFALKSAIGMINFCRNNVFDTPSNNEYLHFSKENSDYEYGIYNMFKCLHCCVHGYKSIEWFKDELPYPWPTDVSTLIIYPESGNQTLYSQQLALADSGNYSCRASNDTHFIHNGVFLKVSDSSISVGWPQTTYRPRDQMANLGESVRFYCEAFVGTIDLPDFASEILWERYDLNKSFINGETIIQENIFRDEKRILGSYLIFKTVSLEDYGKYTCKVKNLGDQIVKLSAWLRHKSDESKETPIHTSQKIASPYTQDFQILVLLLVAAAVMSTITLLHFRSYLKMMKKFIFPMRSTTDDSKKDLLIIHHQSESETLNDLLAILKHRHKYSCSLHPLNKKSQMCEEKLKAKANSYRGILVLMTPKLMDGVWSCGSIYSTIQSLVKVHFTVICFFVQGLPQVNETEQNLLQESLNKIHFIDGTKHREPNFWNCIRLKFFLSKTNEIRMESLKELI